MLKALNELVESRIQEAAEAGDFDNLPGAGQPLVLDDDPLVPEEVRTAHRVLKNAGYVPPEVDQLREAANLQLALGSISGEPSETGDETPSRARRRLLAISLALQESGINLSTIAHGRYYHRSLYKLAGQPDPDQSV